MMTTLACPLAHFLPRFFKIPLFLSSCSLAQFALGRPPSAFEMPVIIAPRDEVVTLPLHLKPQRATKNPSLEPTPRWAPRHPAWRQLLDGFRSWRRPTVPRDGPLR